MLRCTSVIDTLTIDGTVSANGINGGAGGAGGSVYITTSVLAGSGGVIRANGGGGGSRPGGGGGRVAIYYGSLSGSFAGSGLFTNVTAFGGMSTGSNYYNAAAGTLFTKSATQTDGDLIINNNGIDTTEPSTVTPLIYPSAGTSNLVGSSTLTDTANGGRFLNVFSATDRFLGLWLNPNTTQNATCSIDDDAVFEIASNTASSLTISSGDMTSLPAQARAGDSYRLVGRFNNLEIRGRGELDFGVHHLWVESGDLTSNNSTTFRQDGGLTAGRLDLNSATRTTTANTNGTVTETCTD